jgi:glycosyltransferase involved in cell wall biosynthesis
MKILFVINTFPSPGHNIHTYNLAKILSKSHELSLVCFQKDTPYPKEHKYYKNVQVVSLEKKNFIAQGTKSILFNIPFCVLTNQSANMAKAIKNICQEVNFDIAMFEPLVMGQYYFCVSNCPKLLFPVDATSRIKQQRIQDAKNKIHKIVCHLDYSLVRKYEERIYDKFNGIIFSSSYDTEYTLKNIKVPAEKVHTMPEGVDLSYFHPSPNSLPQKPSIAFLGEMGHYPNHHGVLWFYNNVWKELKQQQPELLFYIVGNNPAHEIKNLSTLDKNIVVTGYVDDFRPYIWQATVFVSPLQTGTGMKNKVLQAMAMAKPVVASPLDVQGIAAENWRNVVIAKSPDEFTKNILTLLTDTQLRKNLEHQARLLVEKNHALEKKAGIFLEIAQTTISQTVNRLAV